MFDKFFPDEYLASTYVIPFEELYENCLLYTSDAADEL